ncbi:MAG: hypothetical protein OEZ13_13715 [Spirochaetia bacterium]|nr:hypothetical protein [Spirochaetia bacterium]
MKYKFKLILFFVILNVCSISIYSENKSKYDSRGNLTENFSSRGIEFFIISDKRRYLLTEDIVLKMKLQNNGEYPVTLYMHRNYLKNFTLIARDPAGKSAPAKNIAYFKEYQDYKDTFFHEYTATNFHSRAIVLKTGESLERSIRLHDIVRIEKNNDNITRYDISAYFYPNPEQSPFFISSENNLSIYISKEKNYLTKTPTVNMPAFRIKKVNITAKETVYLALSAEYKKDWPNFFKYISFRDIIKDYPEFARRYMRAEEHEKHIIINEFSEYLMNRKTHNLVKFEILSENPDNNIAKVQVKALRTVEGFKREFSYSYYLTRADNLWYITGIEATLIK